MLGLCLSILVILGYICPLAVSYNQKCLKYIEAVGDISNMSDMSSILNKINQQIKYSGVGYNSQGDYFKCIQSEGRSYYILELDDGRWQTLPPVFYAICLNNSCTGEDVKELVNTLGLILKVKRVIEPKIAETETKTVTWQTVITLFLFLTCVLLTIVMSISQKLQSIRQSQAAPSGPKTKDKPPNRFLRVFSIQHTMSKIYKPGQVKYLNGLKAICLFLIITNHEQLAVLTMDTSTVSNIYSIQNIRKSITTTITSSFAYAIDVFFYISGFMLGYNFPKHFLKEGNWAFPWYFIKRFREVLPLYLFCIAIYQHVMPSFGSGPFFWKAQELTSHCSQSWWMDLLFVGNFLKLCLQWGWYVQVQMQLLVFSLVLLFAYTRLNHKLSTLIQWLCILGSVIYIGLLCTNNEFKVCAAIDDLRTEKFRQLVYKVLHNPVFRIPPYVFGVAIGLLYFEYKERNHRNYFLVRVVVVLTKKLKVRVACVVLGLSLLLFIMLVPHTLGLGMQWSQPLHSLYIATAPLAIVFSIFLITLPIMMGYSNPIQTLLEFAFLQHISKAYLAIYLFHGIYLTWRNLTTPYTSYISPLYILFKSLVDLVPITVGGLILAICVGYPLTGLMSQLRVKRGRNDDVF